ncbi:MAG: tRNA pseudouridine(55) synthase TruB [Tissierellia bacterium]|nr:tRNA pseudouridine(55) synthase TruB [Tissierellia bacterium]
MKYNGVLNIYKEKGYTSNDVVCILRKILGMKKIGHGGTLDPDVTGVLPLLLGQGTKLSEVILNKDKEYIGEMIFGQETTTKDASGEIINQSAHRPKKKEVEEFFQKISSTTIEQIPPMYSAVKVKGKKLYEYARKGEEIQRKTRRVQIGDMELIRQYKNRVVFRVQCSKGTYIRTLVDDIGKELGSYAYLSHLIRTKTAGLSIEESISLKQVSTIKNIEDWIHPMDEFLQDLEALEMDGEKAKILCQGGFLPFDGKVGNYRLYHQDQFIGILETRDRERRYLKMKKRLL